MKFAWIPPGTFLMGSLVSEKGRSDNETPHTVTLSKPYYLAIHPVTQASWLKIMGNNPSHFKGDDLPVEQISWDDCQEFISRLSERDGNSYRLPTEAEWEYACRAGTTTPFSFGTTITAKQVNFNNFLGKTTVVGSYPPNAWGLYDMHGNVWEWCADWFAPYPQGDALGPIGPESGSKRVLRGGSYLFQPSSVRSAYRYSSAPSFRYSVVGFRLVRTIIA
jgi:formylglycine-generating enzyme required for sulfatase activity